MTKECACKNADRKMELKLIRRKVEISRIVVIFLLALNIVRTESSDNKTNNKDTDDKDVSERLKLLDNLSGRSFNDLYKNGTFRTGSALWDNILNKCSLEPSVSCLQKNVYSYLDDSLDNNEVNFNGICFKKNNVDLNKYSKEANLLYLSGIKEETNEKRSFEEDNEIRDDEESESPLEEVTDALYNKVNKFLVTHDLKLTLPEYFFGGATLKVSPRALTKTGALVHIDLEPKETNGEGRLFLKKIKQHIKKKLVLAFIGIILVIKLIALKLIFVLPIITGVTTAKKLFLKVLLFLFPALSHIFKLCSWYHQSYHGTKYHHHHHLITHQHKPPHAPVYGPPPHAPVYGPPPHAPVYGPPSHSYGDHGGGHGAFTVVKPLPEGEPVYEHYPQDWELSGPGLGPEYLASDIHRNAIASFKPNINDANDINSWGLGLPPGPSPNTGEYFPANNNAANAVPSFVATQKLAAAVPGRPVGPTNHYIRNRKATTKDPLQAEKDALIRAAALAARVPPSPVRDEILRVSALKLTETNRVKTETELVKQQQQILAASDPETIAAEKFYSPLVKKVNEILTTLGTPDPECRERVICALYNDPFKHAPYSNLVSNELSKNTNELPPAAESKSAAMYYRYVQAARDGQEEKNCAVTYPDCNIDFKKKK